MSRAVLNSAAESSGVRFEVVSDGRAVSVDSWLRLDAAVPAGVSNLAPLWAAVGADLAQVEPLSITVPWSLVASWTSAQLEGLGLPRLYEHGLRVDRRGLVNEPTFRVTYQFVRLSGQPFAGVERVGASLRIGRLDYTLPARTFEAVAAIDAWGALVEQGSDSADSHLVSLAPVLELLSSGDGSVRADGYLSTIHISPVSTFSIRPFRNQAGEPDFDPTLGRATTAGITEEGGIEPALPAARSEAFSKQFRDFAEVRGRYAVGGGWLVLIEPHVQAALRVAKRQQSSSAADRARFIRNPRTTLRAELGESLEEATLDALFWESPEYGARVREIGLRTPPVIPFVLRPSQLWLPPESGGLWIGAERLELTRQEAVELAARLEEAIERGTAEVSTGDRRVPANAESIAAVRALISALDRPAASAPDETVDESPAHPAPQDPVTLLVEDNLERVTYTGSSRAAVDVTYGIPSQLAAALFAHQARGLEWLQESWGMGRPGVLLADDMGLGKTLQVLAFLSWVKEQRPSDPRPMLIVAPTGLIANWIAEHDRHLLQPGLGEPLALTSGGFERVRLPQAMRGRETIGGLPALDVTTLRRASWVLTTYETLRDYQHSLGQVAWHVLVLDEAQRIKNPIALATEAVKAMNADFRIAMTGTPVENHIADLWSVVDAVSPGRLGSLKDFVTRSGTSVAALQQIRDDLAKSDPPALMLRRMKEDHLRGLPTLSTVPDGQRLMPQIQADAYDRCVAQARASSGRRHMMQTLQDLRRTSTHPDPTSSQSDEAYVRASAKLSYLCDVLDRLCDAREKALVFLESIDIQGALAGIIQRRYRLDRPPMILNGSVTGSRRLSMVEDFQREEGCFEVMILSPRAGGVGLTLTAANHVIHLMRWWNPAVEDQATDRVYRIGQRRPVHVYLPAAVHPVHREHTFDLRLGELLERKRRLSRGVLAPNSFTDADMEELFEDSTRTG